MKLTVVIQQDEDGRFNASCPELKGCHSYGNTYEDALNNIREAIELYLQDIPKSELKKYIAKVKIEKIAICPGYRILPELRMNTYFKIITVIISVVLTLALSVIIVELSLLSFTNPEVGLKIISFYFSWPLIILIVLFTLCTMFKEPISHLIERVQEFDFPGGRIKTSEPQILPSTDKNPFKGEISFEEWTFKIIKKFTPVELEALKEMGAQQQEFINRMIRIWWFEKIWNHIYGTQFEFIEKLVKKNGTIEFEELMFAFYQHIQNRNKFFGTNLKLDDEKTHSFFKDYVAFLNSTGLLEIKDSKITSNKYAAEFLQYCYNEGYRKEFRNL